ncbi:MAG: YkgJ family cysteine cluster protein [Myxococcales bacterium]|nr:YkgJ family cysteine cluster protein [Myxococcales bacterium]MCB9583287.1 YkgJ family cysteine cluster protein [Polyangiaceae bacterium]
MHLKVLHAEVDAEAQALAARHASRLHCRQGCSACCTDDLTVLEVEARRIREANTTLLQNEQPAPAGRCAFLDAEGACRIYQDRPYVCRTQGLPLRFLSEDEDGEIVEERDICPENAAGPALESMDEAELWLIGPREEQLVELQLREHGELRRIPLRQLFRQRG